MDLTTATLSLSAPCREGTANRRLCLGPASRMRGWKRRRNQGGRSLGPAGRPSVEWRAQEAGKGRGQAWLGRARGRRARLGCSRRRCARLGCVSGLRGGSCVSAQGLCRLRWRLATCQRVWLSGKRARAPHSSGRGRPVSVLRGSRCGPAAACLRSGGGQQALSCAVARRQGCLSLARLTALLSGPHV